MAFTSSLARSVMSPLNLIGKARADLQLCFASGRFLRNFVLSEVTQLLAKFATG